MTIKLYGIHPVLEALKKRPRAFKNITLSRKEGKTLDPLLELASKAKINVCHDVPEKIAKLANSDSHQGVVAEVEPYPFADLHTLVANARKEDRKLFFLVLDSIQDPHNFGSLIRSALCSGVQAVIFPKDRSAQLNGTVAKSSAGAIEHMQFCRVVNIASALDALKKENVWIAGAFAESKDILYSIDFDMDLALVIGNEEKGVRPLIRKKCDFSVSIPMAGEFDSLNASVAGAVIMFEVMKQRLNR
jgi:23S rRNA (guanosine2251-2'-O)-methyltransferase